MEKELRVRDDIIHELEVRLTLPPNNEDMLNGGGGGDTPDYTIEMKNLQTQLEALQTALAYKDNEIEALKVEASEAKAAAIANTISGKQSFSTESTEFSKDLYRFIKSWFMEFGHFEFPRDLFLNLFDISKQTLFF